MNKQELIKAVIELPVDLSGLRPKIDKLTTLELIKLLNEQKPVKVPQFVADWIEKCKRGLSIRQAMSQVQVGIEVDDWLMKVDADGAFVNQDLFARAWLVGYEVEKEPKYTVKIKEIAKYKNYLVFGEISRTWFFASVQAYDVIFKHTRKELEEAGFGWVFNCPGIEIEEVEE